MKTYIATILANITDAQCAVNEETGKITDWHGANQPTDAQVQAWYDAYQEPDPMIAESLAYLATTDWYYIRFAETGQPVPSAVVAKRVAAREYLNQ